MYTQGHKLKRVKKLPNNLEQAIKKFSNDAVVKKSIGAKVVSKYVKLKKRELKEFRSFLKENKINQKEIINRQHYLKFSYKTFAYLSKNLVSMDCSIAFAANPGFRCGTSRTFSMFDLHNGEILNIKQQPLIIMDNSILSETYMGVLKMKMF